MVANSFLNFECSRCFWSHAGSEEKRAPSGRRGPRWQNPAFRTGYWKQPEIHVFRNSCGCGDVAADGPTAGQKSDNSKPQESPHGFEFVLESRILQVFLESCGCGDVAADGPAAGQKSSNSKPQESPCPCEFVLEFRMFQVFLESCGFGRKAAPRRAAGGHVGKTRHLGQKEPVIAGSGTWPPTARRRAQTWQFKTSGIAASFRILS